MKLPVTVTREPRHRGQPAEFVARLGSLEGWGTSLSNALAALASRIERVASAFTRPDVPEGAVIGRGTVAARDDRDDRDEVVAAMDRHFLQLHGPPCVQHMGCWCAHHARGAKYSEPCNATE